MLQHKVNMLHLLQKTQHLRSKLHAQLQCKQLITWRGTSSEPADQQESPPAAQHRMPWLACCLNAGLTFLRNCPRISQYTWPLRALRQC